MAERSHRSGGLIQVLGLLVTVAAAALSVTVPEARRLLGLDPSHDRSREEHTGSPPQNLADSSTGYFVDQMVPAPAPVSADTFSQVVNEPVEVEQMMETVTTVSVETTYVTP